MAFTDIEYKEMAVLAIFNYYEGEYSKEYIEANFGLAIKMLVDNASSVQVVAGASSITENGISITYKDNYGGLTLTSDILALLPKKSKFRVW